MHWDLKCREIPGCPNHFHLYVLRSDSNVVACSTDSNEIYSDCSGIGLVLEHDLLFP